MTSRAALGQLGVVYQSRALDADISVELPRRRIRRRAPRGADSLSRGSRAASTSSTACMNAYSAGLKISA
jgi:hypothetical protein